MDEKEKTKKGKTTSEIECKKTIQLSHSSSVHSVAFSSDGTMLASGNWKGYPKSTVKLWSMPEGNLLNTLDRDSDNIYTVAFNHDGTMLASGSWDDTIKLWSLPEGNLLKILEVNSDDVNSVAFSPDCTILASGDSIIIIWNTAIGEMIDFLKDPACEIEVDCDNNNYPENCCSCNTVNVCTCDTICTCDTVCTSDSSSSCSYWYQN